MKQGTSVANPTFPLGSFVESQTGIWLGTTVDGRQREEIQAAWVLEPGPRLTQDTVADSFCPTSPSGLREALELGGPVDREKLGFPPRCPPAGWASGRPASLFSTWC